MSFWVTAVPPHCACVCACVLLWMSSLIICSKSEIHQNHLHPAPCDQLYSWAISLPENRLDPSSPLLQRLSFYNCTGTALHAAQRDQYICFPSKSRLHLPLPVRGYVKSQSVEQFVVSNRCCRLLLAYMIRDALQSCTERSIAAAAFAWPPACPASCHTGLQPSLTEP